MGSPASLPAGTLTTAPSFAKAALSAANGVASGGAMADRRSTRAGARARVSVTGAAVGGGPARRGPLGEGGREDAVREDERGPDGLLEPERFEIGGGHAVR